MRYPPFRRARKQPFLGLIINHHLKWWLLTREIAFSVPITLILNGLVHYDFNMREVQRFMILQHLGESSFSLYLTHYLAIVILINARVIVIYTQWIRFILTAIVCVIVGELAYLLIEKCC